MYSDGKPVINPNPVMFEVVMSGPGTGPATKPATSIVPVDGIAQFAVMPEAATEHIIVRVWLVVLCNIVIAKLDFEDSWESSFYTLEFVYMLFSISLSYLNKIQP